MSFPWVEGGKSQKIKRQESQSHLCPLPGFMGTATSQEPESLEPTKRDVVDMRDAENTRFPPRRTAHQQASACTAESQEHTVLFVGAEICSVLIMQADEWASLAFALIWSPTREAQSQASDPGNRLSFLAIHCSGGIASTCNSRWQRYATD